MKKTLALIFLLGAVWVASLYAMTVMGYVDLLVYSSAPASPTDPRMDRFFATSSGLGCKTSTGANCLPSSAGVTLETDGTPNGSQTLLNLAAGSNMTLTDNGTGTVTLASSVGTSGQNHGIGMAWGAAGGTALTTGNTQYSTVPFACNIAGWNMTVDTGTATVDVWKLAAAPSDWTALSGTVNTSSAGNTVTWVSGSTFPADAAGRGIYITGVLYEIASVPNSTSLVLVTSPGNQTGASFTTPGTAVPTATNKIDGSSLPAVASGTFAGSTNLSGWTSGNTGTHVIKNDVFGFNINAVSGAAAISIVLECNQ